MQRCYILFACGLLLLSYSPSLAQSPKQAGKAKEQVAEMLIFLVDYSGSIAKLEDWTQPLVTQVVRAAELTQSNRQIAVIFFGGKGVQVKGPTATYASLHQELIKSWPRPEGATPLDEAMEQAVKICKNLPSRTRTTVVLFTDGKPDSGRLRPETFPPMKTAIEQLLAKEKEQNPDLPEAFLQQFLAKLERKLLDSPASVPIYHNIQLPLEYKKTLQHAAELKGTGARFLLFDYSGKIPELKEIHDAAGGAKEDFILALPPRSILPIAHKLGLAGSSRRVCALDPQEFKGQASSYSFNYTCRLDPVAGAGLITAVFHAPLPNYGNDVLLSALVQGKKTEFPASNDQPDLFLARDSAGNVVTATWMLPALPPDRNIALQFSSPQSTFSFPGMTLYVHLRLADDVFLDFRPVALPKEAEPPFRLSPHHPTAWVVAYRSKTTGQTFPLKGAEILFQQQRDRSAREHLTAAPDPHAKDALVTESKRFATGIYDAEVHLSTDTGAKSTVHLPGYLESQEANERLRLSMVYQAKLDQPEAEGATHDPSHPDFGEVGDETTEAKLFLYFTTADIDYPLTVVPKIVELADSAGTPLTQVWITYQPSRLTILPDKRVRLTLLLKMPAQVQDELKDGVVKGKIQFYREEGPQVGVIRGDRVSGVADDAPVDVVSFNLRRPTFTVSLPRCWRNNVYANQGKTGFPLQVAIAHPFQETYYLDIRHDSLLTRSATVTIQPLFRDQQQKTIPAVFLKLAETTQDIPPKKRARFPLVLELGNDFQVTDGELQITIQGPGMPTQVLYARLWVRRPLLGKEVQYGLFGLAVFLLVSAIPFYARYRKANRFRAESHHSFGHGGTIADLGKVQMESAGSCRLTLLRPCLLRLPGENQDKEFPANKSVRFKIADLHPSRPLVLSALATDDAEPMTIALTDSEQTGRTPKDCRLMGEVQEAGHLGEQAQKSWRTVVIRFLLAMVATGLAVFLFQWPVLQWAQYVFDFFTLPW